MANTSQQPAHTKTIFTRNIVPAGVGVGLAIVYGLITRTVLNEILNGTGALSVAFFGLTPLGLGFLTVMIAPKELRTSTRYIFTAPWVACIACMLIVAIVAWEFVFCIVLAMPLLLGLSSVGGGAAALVWLIARNSNKSRLGALAVMLALPYLSASVERSFPAQEWIRPIESQIEISAPPDIVWANITNLAEIQPSERPVSFYHLIGLPRPVVARMACQQVGCIRRGDWENGLAFDGTITRIEPERSYWVSLEADTSRVHVTWAPLGSIGGAAFDMVDDGYVIEPLAGGRSILHLYSTYRVSTRINPYASLWLDLIMRDIQGSILSVEKARCERQANR
jgi:hypothetical protein